MLVAHGEQRMLVGAAFDGGKESGKFCVTGQLDCSVEGAGILAKNPGLWRKWMPVMRQGLTKAPEIFTLRGSL
jgi:hypothetical protein